MNCYTFEQILSDYIDGTLSPSQRVEAEKHLEDCAVCREKLCCMKDAVNCLRNLPKVCACDEFEAHLLARIEKEKNKENRRSFMTVVQDYSRAISLSAAAILLVAASVFVYSSLSVNGQSASAPAASVRAAAPAAGLPASISNTAPAYSVKSSRSTAPADTGKQVIPDNNSRIMMVNE